MSKGKTLILVLVCVMFGAAAGGFAGFYAAINTPVVPNVAVLDVERLANGIDPRSPDAMVKADLLAKRTKQVSEKLTAAGMIVLDRAKVLAAPEEAVIRVDAN